MKPIEKILVPIDFSEHGRDALQFAADLSGRYEAPLELVHVLQLVTHALPEGYTVPTTQQFNEIVTRLQKQLSEAELEALQAGACEAHSTLLQGAPGEEILRFAAEGKYDLVVMGVHGRSGLKHLLMGSVAEKVVRASQCPVLAVRSRT